MSRSIGILTRARIVSLLVIAGFVLGVFALALDQVFASPQGGSGPSLDISLKDEDDDNSGRGSDDDDDDDDDNSGKGSDNSGRGSDHSGHGDGDGEGEVVARPDIPRDELGEVVIEIIDERFVPATATVDPGQRVTFVNLDDDEHTATGPGFDTGVMNGGEWRTVTLENPGNAAFVCQFHPEMQGTITVTGEAAPTATAAPAPAADEPNAAAEQPAPEPVTIEIVDFAFATSQLEIAAGTMVTWVNNGVAPHTVTGPFGDSGVMQPGDAFNFTFSEAGRFDYVCQFHPQMTPSITVTASAARGTDNGSRFTDLFDHFS